MDDPDPKVKELARFEAKSNAEHGVMVQIRELLQTYSIVNYVISLFVDVTSIFVTAELIFTGFRLRKFTKTQKDSKEVRDAA